MAQTYRVFYQYFYDINENPRIVQYECSDPQELLDKSTVKWTCDRAIDLLGHSLQPNLIWESQINLVNTLDEALSGLSARISDRIAWMEVRLDMARQALDQVAVSGLWNKEEK